MDKKDASMLGLGVFAAVQLAESLHKKENSSKSVLMRTENNNQNTSNQAVGNTFNETEQNGMMPGISLSDFKSERYKVSFKYPSSWSKNPRYEDKYEGTTGFFEIGDFASDPGENIDEAVEEQIDEDYKPYGTNPIVRRFVVDGQPARVIYSSADQPTFYKDREVAIVVQYPNPITVDGQRYEYVVIWVSREYVPLIISTLKFVN